MSILSKVYQKTEDNISDLIFSNVKTTLSQSLYSAIDVGENDSLYTELHKFIHKLNPSKYDKFKLPVNSGVVDLADNALYYLRAGLYTWIQISSYIETVEYNNNNNHPPTNVKRLKIVVFGKNHDKIFYRIITNCKKYNDNNLVKIIDASRFGLVSYKQSRSFDTIILHDEIKKHLIDNLNQWKRDEKWYKNHQMVYKKGILLHGEPGTGKSSIIQAISTMFDNANIISFGCNTERNLDVLVDMREEYDGTLIIVLEDIDMCFQAREPGVSKFNTVNTESDGQRLLFQIIDGMYSFDNTIFIATTNHIDQLDPALIRAGRFDISVNLECFDKELAIRYVNKFGYDESVLDELNVSYPIQPALLQSKIMEYRSKNIL